MDHTEFVNVTIRIRPGDEHKESCLQIISEDPPVNEKKPILPIKCFILLILDIIDV